MRKTSSRSRAETLLYGDRPHRRSTVRAHARRERDGLAPEAYSKSKSDGEPWFMQTECILEGTDATRVEVRVRFLQPIQEPRSHENRDSKLRAVGLEQGFEREVSMPSKAMPDLLRGYRAPIRIASRCPNDNSTGAPLRSMGRGSPTWSALSGELEVVAKPSANGIFLIRTTVINNTRWAGARPDEARTRTFVGCRTVLSAEDGSFVSLLNPPRRFQPAAEVCRNVHTWPVLIGEEGSRDQMLSTPLIVCDYPRTVRDSASALPAVRSRDRPRMPLGMPLGRAGYLPREPDILPAGTE